MKNLVYISIILVFSSISFGYNREYFEKNNSFSARVFKVGNGALYNFARPSHNPESADVVYAGSHPNNPGWNTNIHYVGHIVSLRLMSRDGYYKQSGYPVRMRITGVDESHSLESGGIWSPSVNLWAEEVEGNSSELQGKVCVLKGSISSGASPQDPNMVFLTDENGMVQWLIGVGNLSLYPNPADPNYYNNSDFEKYEWPGTYSPFDKPYQYGRKISYVASRVHFEFDVESQRQPGVLLFFNKSHAVYRRFPGQDALSYKSYPNMGTWSPVFAMSFFSFQEAPLFYPLSLGMNQHSIMSDEEGIDSLAPRMEDLIVRRPTSSSEKKYLLGVNLQPGMLNLRDPLLNDPNVFSIKERFLTRLESGQGEELYWFEASDGIYPMVSGNEPLSQRLSKTIPYSVFISSESALPVGWSLNGLLECGVEGDPNFVDPNYLEAYSSIQIQTKFHSQSGQMSYANTPWIAFSSDEADKGYHLDDDGNSWVVLNIQDESYLRFTWIPQPDYNADGVVNLKDLSLISESWGLEVPEADISLIDWLGPDLKVGFDELIIFLDYWLEEIEY